MNARQGQVLLWFSALVLVLACVPSIGTASPTADPNQINQFIAQTAAAAASRTAAALPTSTGTATITPTPGTTLTPSPTFTSTVIFLLPTLTIPPTETPTFSLGGGGTGTDDWACEVLRITPPPGTSVESGDHFDVIWTVRNIGLRKWNEGVVDYMYESGEIMHTTARYEIPSDVRSGGSIDLLVPMDAPNDSGTYTTTWALRRGDNWFCQMFFTISVR